MAGVVVGRALGLGDAGRLEADVNKPFVDIADFGIPQFSLFSPFRILRKQTAEMPQVAAASACVADDGIDLFQREKIHQAAGDAAGGFQVSIVGME